MSKSVLCFCVHENWLLVTHMVSHISVLPNDKLYSRKAKCTGYRAGQYRNFYDGTVFIKYHGIK